MSKLPVLFHCGGWPTGHRKSKWWNEKEIDVVYSTDRDDQRKPFGQCAPSLGINRAL